MNRSTTQESNQEGVHPTIIRSGKFKALIAGSLLILGISGYLIWKNNKLSRTINSAQFAIAVSDWSNAQQLAEIWVKETPDDGDAWIALAEATRHLKQFDRTAECLKNVPRQDRRYLKVLELRGDLLFSELGQPLQAIENWQQMLDTQPDYPVAHQRLIYAYAMTQQRAKLVDQIHLAIQQKCEQTDAYIYLMLASNLQFSDGYLRTTEWLQAHPDDPSLQVAQAIYAMRVPPSKTLEQFGAKTFAPDVKIAECERKYPQNLDLNAFLMDRDIVNGEIDSLRTRLSRMTQDAEEDPRIWRFRGWLAMADQQTDLAITFYKKSIQRHPYDWKARHALATALRLANRLDEAEEQASLANRGKTLEADILHLPNTIAIDRVLLNKMHEYSVSCGDEILSAALQRRLNERESRPPHASG